MAGLSDGLIGRLRERAGNAAERSGASNLQANSQRPDAMLDKMQSSDPGVRDYVAGINSPLAGMMSTLVAGDRGQARGLMGMLGALIGGQGMMMGGQVVGFGGGAPAAAPPPCTAQALDDAEAALGFALPADLRRFYAEVADGYVGPGDGLFALRELVAKWREMNREPVGPRGQKWTQNLIPIHGERWDLTCIDRDSGAIIAFDPEEIDDGGWKKAFKPEADSLAAWLDAWLGARSPHQQMQDEMAAARNRWADEWIATLETKSEAHRATHGFTGPDWRDQVRKRALGG